MPRENQRRCLNRSKPWVFQSSSGGKGLEGLSSDNFVFNQRRVRYDPRHRAVLKLREESITKIRQFVTHRVEQVRMLNRLLQLDVFLGAALKRFPLVDCHLRNCWQPNRGCLAVREPFEECGFLKLFALKFGGILD